MVGFFSDETVSWFARRGRAAGMLLLLALATSSAPSLAGAETVLRVGDQKGNARAALEAAGLLADLPYKIEWAEFPAAAPLLEAASAGALDAGTVGDAPFTFAVAAGAPIKAIVATRSGQEGLAVLVRGDSPIKSFRDLVGKKIATGRGSIGHQLVLAALEANGLKTEDVNLVFLPPSDAGGALLRGSVDAWSTWDPYSAQLETARGARPVINADGLMPGLSFFFARADAIASPEKRAALADLTKRLTRARAWGLANVDKYAEFWSKLVGLPVEIGRKINERAHARAEAIDASVIADEQKTIDLYLRSGLIAKRVDAAQALDPVFTEEIVAGAAQN